VPEDNIHPVPFVPEPADLAGHETQGRLEVLELRMDQAAQRYETWLRLQARPGEPVLDLVLLGLGTDGHTASLFPGTPALHERNRWVVPNRAAYEDRHPERITLTLPALNAAEVVMFLVTGQGKSQVLAQVLQSPRSSELPAAQVRPASGRLVWLVDRAAASALT
jgi:6-phosphogluconolactonase